MRPHLASLVEDFRTHRCQTAVVAHRGVRSYRTTYGDLAQLAGRFAAELGRRGVAPGERVVLWGENSAEWIAAFFGCLLRGVLAVPLDAAGSVSFAERVIAEVTPRLIVGDARLLAGLRPELDRLAFTEMASRLPAGPDFTVSDAVREDAPFQIVFTSGTTAEPKGIVHTHRNVLASLRPIETEIAKYLLYERWFHPLRFLHTLPLSHVFGQFMGLWLPASLAAELHFTDALEPARAVELIRRERVSVLIAVPRIVEMLRGHLLRRFPSLAADLEPAGSLPVLKRWWRFRAVHRALGFKFWAVISGGASLPPDLERFWNTLGFALIQGYGMTETAALVTLNHPFKAGRGTIGKVLPGREVRLSDSGEMLVRGDMVSGAAWRNGRMEPREGEWLATGDLAERNDAGELRFLGRMGDAIVTSAGLNIYPSDLEAALKRQPGVRECVVVPCEFANGVEPVAVVLFAGEDDALPQLVSAANSGLAGYQHIRRAMRWPELDLPYGSTGKLLRRAVRDWACAALRRQETESPAPSDPLLALIAEVTGEPPAKGDANLRLSEDLHLDSLGRVQLASALEQRTGVELQDDEIAGLKTLGELGALLAKSGTAAGAGMSASAPPDRTAAGPAGSGSYQDAIAQPIQPVHSAPAQQPPYPRWPWSWPVRILRVIFLEAVARPLTWFLAAPRIALPSRGLPAGPLLIVANHVTAFDAALVLYALPRHLRSHVAIAMSGEILMDFRRGRRQPTLLQNLLAPAAYYLLTALFNVFPLPRVQGFRRSFTHAGEAMDRGYSVLIFPEGTRSRDGLLHSFRPGIGLLAEQSRVPVLPVALIGLGELRSRKRWFRSGRLEVRVGEPVTMPEQTSPTEWTATLESALRRLTAD
jgi:long-chain acyl-CoA synthetase